MIFILGACHHIGRNTAGIIVRDHDNKARPRDDQICFQGLPESAVFIEKVIPNIYLCFNFLTKLIIGLKKAR